MRLTCAPVCCAPRRSAIVLGSLLPLCMFLAWDAVALSMLPPGLLADHAAAAGGAAGVMLASLPLAPSAADAASGAGGSLSANAAGTEAAAAAALQSMAAAVVDGPGAALVVDPLQVWLRVRGLGDM